MVRKLTDEQERLCIECNKQPRGKPRLDFLDTHDITMEEVFRYNQSIRDTPNRRKRINKTRAETLRDQGGGCALCGTPQHAQWRTDQTGQVVCGKCSWSLSTWRKLRADGISEADMIAFEQSRR